MEFLETLGVSNFDVCIVAIASDFQSSLETTAYLKDLGAKMVVSRASRDVHARFLLRNGADEIVYPEKQVANWTAIRYSSEHIFDYVQLSDTHAIFEIEMPQNWVGKTIGQVDIRKKFNINIMALKRDGSWIWRSGQIPCLPMMRPCWFWVRAVISRNVLRYETIFP